jgi:hypothetical protein
MRSLQQAGESSTEHRSRIMPVSTTENARRAGFGR